MTQTKTCAQCVFFRKDSEIDTLAVCDNPNSGVIDVNHSHSCSLLIEKGAVLHTGSFKLYQYGKYAGNTSNQLKKHNKECSMCGKPTTQATFFQKNLNDPKTGYEICPTCAPVFIEAWSNLRIDDTITHTPTPEPTQLNLF